MKEICRDKDGKLNFTTLAFYLGLLERLTESCLIDADRTATAKFMEALKLPNRLKMKYGVIGLI